jgi:hypothetical protein
MRVRAAARSWSWSVVIVVAAGACGPKPTPPTPPGNPGGTPVAGRATGPIGTPGAIVIEASDPDGRWVVACQARTDTNGDGKVEVNLGLHGDTYGDAMRPYLIVGSGDGEPVDAFVDQTADGAWLVVIRDGALVLVGANGERTELAEADTRDDRYPTLGPRPAAFAGNERVVFMRHRKQGDVVVSRELRGGREIEAAVAGAVWRVEPDAGGVWTRVLSVRKDSDGNGALEWPTQHTSLSDRGCRGPITSYGTYGAAGDEPDVLWVAIDNGDVVDDDTVVTVAGDALVRIGKDKALTIGTDVVLPAGCDPTVRGSGSDPARVIAGCGATKDGKTRLVLIEGTTKRDLGVDAERTDSVRRLAPGDRVACIDRELCVDVVSGMVHQGAVIYADGDRVLVRDGERYVVADGAGKRTPLGAIEGYPEAAAGPILAIGKTIVDLSTASIRGTVDGSIAAVDRAGRALVTTRTAADTPGPDLPGGPARWVDPK